jgi:hypothetical protein
VLESRSKILSSEGFDVVTYKEFFAQLMDQAADPLDSYGLTGAEKLGLLTGDITWIEEHIGPLTREQRRWLDLRRSAEIW